MHVDEIERMFAASGAEWAEPPAACRPAARPGTAGSVMDPTVR
jgi:hypothetical protein